MLSFFPSRELAKPVVLILLMRLKIANCQNTLKSEGTPKIYEIETAIYVRSVVYELKEGGGCNNLVIFISHLAILNAVPSKAVFVVWFGFCK